MKTNIEIREEIWSKINSISLLQDKRLECIDKDYNTDANSYLELVKQINYKQGGVKRQIRNLYKKVFGFEGEWMKDLSYYEMVKIFIKQLNN